MLAAGTRFDLEQTLGAWPLQCCTTALCALCPTFRPHCTARSVSLHTPPVPPPCDTSPSVGSRDAWSRGQGKNQRKGEGTGKPQERRNAGGRGRKGACLEAAFLTPFFVCWRANRAMDWHTAPVTAPVHPRQVAVHLHAPDAGWAHRAVAECRQVGWGAVPSRAFDASLPCGSRMGDVQPRQSKCLCLHAKFAVLSNPICAAGLCQPCVHSYSELLLPQWPCTQPTVLRPHGGGQ